MSLTGNIEGKTLNGKINKLSEIRGYSAYEIAVINGFSGTEEEWLESLEGKDCDISSIVIQYAVSDRKDLPPSNWLDEIPEMTAEKPYLWILITKSYTNGTAVADVGIIGYYAGSSSGSGAEQVSAAATDYDRNVKAINHRGFHTAPENTIPAYILSKKNGFNYVECDVAFTSDNVPVLLHDGTIDRTSDGSGNISEMTYAEASQYDYGSWKSAAYAGTHLPTLEEFLLTCRGLGLHPYIEIKSTGATQEGVEAIVTAVENAGMRGKVTYISFNSTYLGYVKDVDASARLGIVSSGNGSIDAVNALKTEDNEVFLDCNYANLTAEGIEACKAAKVPLEVWTVNSETAIRNIDPYISGISSDKLIAGKVLYEQYSVYTAPDAPEVPATGITLSATNLVFNSTESQTITAAVEPSTATDKVVWTSSANSVASVNGGTVTPVANGTAVITATAGSVSAQCSVTVELSEEAVTYTVTNNLTNVTNSNSATGVTEGASYSATLSAISGYAISGVTVTMGGTDITASAYADGTVNIGSVTGNVVITATAVETESDGMVWKSGQLNASGEIVTDYQEGMYCENYVPVTAGDTIYFYNTDKTWTSTAVRVLGYDTNKNFVGEVSVAHKTPYNSQNWACFVYTIPDGVAYIRAFSRNLESYYSTACVSHEAPVYAFEDVTWGAGYLTTNGGMTGANTNGEMFTTIISVEPGSVYRFGNTNPDWTTDWNRAHSYTKELAYKGNIQATNGSALDYTVPEDVYYLAVSSRNLADFYTTATFVKVS